MGEMVRFPANGKEGQGYLARPSSPNGRGVVVIQEWWGVNDNIKSIADRFADEGYLALAPDLYDGKVVDEPDEAGKLFMALNIEQAEKDLRGSISYLKNETGRPVATIGFCMGGALSLFAACQADGDVGACADFYGIHPAVKYDWDNLTAPVLGIWAEHDDAVTANVPSYEQALKERGKTYEFHHYPGTEHAFFNDQNDVYNPEAAADAWRKTLAFFDRHL